jgi:hypothetical protein
MPPLRAIHRGWSECPPKLPEDLLQAAGKTARLRKSRGKRRKEGVGGRVLGVGRDNKELQKGNGDPFHCLGISPKPSTAARYAFVRWQRRHVTAEGSVDPDAR